MSPAVTAAAAAMAALVQAAGAPNWVEIKRNAQRIAYYDAGRIERRGDIVRFTLRFDMATPDEGATRRTHDVEVDCARRTARMLNGIDLDDAGTVVRTHEVPPDLVLHRPIPPGPGDRMLALVCR